MPINSALRQELQVAPQLVGADKQQSHSQITLNTSELSSSDGIAKFR